MLCQSKSLSDEIKEWKKKINEAIPQDMYKDYIVEEAVIAFRSIAKTLFDVHELGYTHRDVKPKNLYRLGDEFLIGDFGIVDIPDSDHKTKKGDKLGAWNTIAPEVLRDPSKTDSKADVYSLAKSFWMYLASNEDGFDGRYDVEYESISLHDIPQYRGKYLVEIDDLLHYATQEDPKKRPSMEEFIAKLKSWEESNNDITKKNKQEWNFIYKILFRGMKPIHAVFTEKEDIVKTLNTLSKYGVLNYSMLPNRGGLQLFGASIASEDGCIYLDYQSTFVCKPKRLVIRSFIGDELWNYFYLEFDNIKYIFKDEICEDLIEDMPGHYIDSKNWVYRVYDYDTEEKLPKKAELVERYCRGAIVFVAKKSFYNKIRQTTDGRHADCTEEVFYNYICEMRNDFNNSKNQNELLEKYAQNPFKKEMPCSEDLSDTDASQNHDLIKKNYQDLDFKDILIEKTEAPIKYRFKLGFMKVTSFLKNLYCNTDYFLCKDGKVKKIEKESDEIYYVYGRENAIE